MSDSTRIEYLKIKNRLILLLTIPILFITIISAILINIILKDYNSLKLTENNIKKAKEVSKTIYYLQYKRGLSIAKNLNILDDLQQKKLNSINSELLSSISSLKNIYKSNIENNKKLITIFDDFKNNNDLENYTNISNTISKLLFFIKTVPAIIDDKENRNYLQAYTYLLENREYLGLIRANLYEVLLKQELSKDSYAKLSEYLSLYNFSKNKFYNAVDFSDEFINYFQNIYNISNINNILFNLENILKNEELIKSKNAKEWFIESSSAIDKYSELENLIFIFINKSLEEKQSSLNTKIIFLVLFLIITFATFYIAINLIARKILTLSNKLYKGKQEFEKIAKTDHLTGFGNRYRLNLDLEKAKNPALAIFNINNFKQTNYFYGYAFGDEIIKFICNKINLLISNDGKLKLYRFQGDEFAIFAKNYNQDEFIQKTTEIIEKIKEKFIVENEEIFLSWNCGISFEDIDKIIRSANMALVNAKENNHDFLVYSDKISLNEKYENNIKWAKTVSTAIKNSKIEVYYQSIVNNKTKNCEKFEALMRLIDENNNAISPYFFLDIAKQTKQYLPLTKIVISKTFETFKNTDLSCSVNLSMKDILNQEMVDFIIKKLEKYDIGKRVVFEIVESEYIENLDGVINFIKKVRKFGSKIAIDDFGTGYSNFEYLIKLNVDFIKIDGSLIKNITKDKNAYLTVATIVNFAKNLNIQTIAEFVENEEIFNIVKELGIDYSQGYYFHKPTPKLWL